MYQGVCNFSFITNVLYHKSSIHCRCSNHNHFTSYAKLGVKLREADDNDIYKMTNCLSSCHKSTFEIELSQQNDLSLDDSQDSALMLATRFPLSRYELREQVLMRETII